MSKSTGTKAAGKKSVERYRARMRRAGLRLIQLWVSDSRASGFTKECRQQSRAAGQQRKLEGDVMDWIDKNRDTEGWTF